MNLPKLAAPAMRALASQSIETLEDLSKLTRSEVAELHGMGPNALGKLEEALNEAGLSFATSTSL